MNSKNNNERIEIKRYAFLFSFFILLSRNAGGKYSAAFLKKLYMSLQCFNIYDTISAVSRDVKMKQKTKSKKFKKNKTLRKALAFFCFFIFTFSLLNLNLACPDSSSNSHRLTHVLDVSKTQATFGFPDTVGNAKKLADEAGAPEGKNLFVMGFNCILYGFFIFFEWMLGLTAYIFDWAVDAKNIRDVIHREAIYNAWKMVRDFLNLGFILILLYSAFCTVFQIEKYHLKKILLMLVLMALLVNFSFPISRFIVDASNVTMYFFLQSAFGDSGTRSFSAAIAGQTNIAHVLVPRHTDDSFNSGGSTTEIIMATFFVVSLMIAMFVIAAILVIRIVALAILIIFSSIGFVAAVLPDTKTFANKWWSNLFKYAFAGPILVFMLLISYNLMAEMKVEKTLEEMVAAAGNYSSDPGALANAAYFFIPIALLWMGIFATRTMSIFGANWVTGKAEGAGKFMARLPHRTAKRAAVGAVVATGAPGGVKQAWEGRKGVRIPWTQTRIFPGSKERGKITEEREAKIAGGFAGGKEGWKAAGDRAKDKRVGEKVDENKKLNVSASQLYKDLDSADEVTKIAAAVTMTEKGLLTDIDRFEKALQAAGNDEDLKKKIIDKSPKDITKSAVTNSAELGRALTATTIKDADGSINTVKTGKMQEAIKGKIKEDNSASILAEYDISKGKSNLNAYKDNFGNMSAEQLAKQKNIHDDAYLTKNPALRNYLDFKDNDYKQKVLSEMSSAGIDAWKKQKIV